MCWLEWNLQGDILGVYNQDGTKLITYAYDAWGNCQETRVGATASSPALHNPFRYRGYYFDTDLQMYYLQSRYYDPAIGRFISPDKFATTGQSVLGANMFAYCLNDPTNRVDLEGFAGIWWTLIDDHEMGFIHKMVEREIERLSLGTVATEITLSGGGRADLVDRFTGEVWEIKHASTDPAGRAAQAYNQVKGYLGQEGVGLRGIGIKTTDFGEEGRFNGAFMLMHGTSLYVVTYCTPSQGVVLYSVAECSLKAAYAYSYLYIYEYIEKAARKIGNNLSDMLPHAIETTVGTGTLCAIIYGVDRLMRTYLTNK